MDKYNKLSNRLSSGFLKKNLENFDILKIIEKFDVFKPYLSTFYEPHSGRPYLSWNTSLGPAAPYCPFNIPVNLASGFKKSQAGSIPLRSPNALYPEFASAVLSCRISNDVLIRTVQRKLSRASYFIAPSQDGSFCLRQSVFKGSAYYGSLVAKAVSSWAADEATVPGSWAFCTLTFADQANASDLTACWNSLWSYVRDFYRSFEGSYDIGRFFVVEAHESGFPHVHCLLHFRNLTFNYFLDKKNKKRIDNDYLVNFIKKSWSCGWVDTYYCDSIGVTDYLTKYLEKGFSMQEVRNLCKNSHLSTSLRKSLLGLCFSTFFKIRSFSCSKTPNSVSVRVRRPSQTYKGSNADVVKNVHDKIQKSSGDLGSLMNNFRRLCRLRTAVFNGYHSKEVLKPFLDRYVDFDTVISWGKRFGSKSCCCTDCKFLKILESSINSGEFP